VLGALALVLLGELVVRIAEAPSGGTGALYDLIVEHGSRFKLRPSTRIRVPERYGTIVYSTNRDGYRDRDSSETDPRRHVVLLGDSVTFGLGVQQDQIYANLLQRQLDERAPGAFDVSNLAIFAYDTDHELDTLREDGLRHHPELVILQFCVNDFSVANRETRPVAGATPASPRAAPAPSLRQRFAILDNQLATKSALYRRLHQVVTGVNYRLLHDVRRNRFPSTLNASQPRQQLAYLASHPRDEQVAAFRLLDEIAKVASEHGARFILLAIPDEVQLFDDGYDEINTRLRAFGAHAGIPVLDVLPMLRGESYRADLFLDGVHLSERGHRLVASYLMASLSSSGYLSLRARLVGERSGGLSAAGRAAVGRVASRIARARSGAGPEACSDLPEHCEHGGGFLAWSRARRCARGRVEARCAPST
jgi:lysophospholipase L1-like esterase